MLLILLQIDPKSRHFWRAFASPTSNIHSSVSDQPAKPRVGVIFGKRVTWGEIDTFRLTVTDRRPSKNRLGGEVVALQSAPSC